MSRFNSLFVPLLLCNEDGACCWLGKLVAGSCEVSLAKEGGAGARGMRYDGSAAGTRGEGKEARRETETLSRGVVDAIEAGRDGKSCDSLSDPLDGFLRSSGGRASKDSVSPIAGDPTQRAVGMAD